MGHSGCPMHATHAAACTSYPAVQSMRVASCEAPGSVKRTDTSALRNCTSDRGGTVARGSQGNKSQRSTTHAVARNLNVPRTKGRKSRHIGRKSRFRCLPSLPYLCAAYIMKNGDTKWCLRGKRLGAQLANAQCSRKYSTGRCKN